MVLQTSDIVIPISVGVHKYTIDPPHSTKPSDSPTLPSRPSGITLARKAIVIIS